MPRIGLNTPSTRVFGFEDGQVSSSSLSLEAC